MNKDIYIAEIKNEFSGKLFNLLNQIEPPILKASEDITGIPYSKGIFFEKFWENIEYKIEGLGENELLTNIDVVETLIETLNFYTKLAIEIANNKKPN